MGMNEVVEQLDDESDSWAMKSQQKQHSGNLANQEVQDMKLLDSQRSEQNAHNYSGFVD